jgi:hypothetical protein
MVTSRGTRPDNARPFGRSLHQPAARPSGC